MRFTFREVQALYDSIGINLLRLDDRGHDLEKEILDYEKYGGNPEYNKGLRKELRELQSEKRLYNILNSKLSNEYWKRRTKREAAMQK